MHEPGEILEIKDLIVNPAGSGGRRYLKVAAAIELAAEHLKNGKKKEAAAEGAHGAGGGLQDAQIRDLLIRELSSRTLDELTDPVTKEEMRQGILDGLSVDLRRPARHQRLLHRIRSAVRDPGARQQE